MRQSNGSAVSGQLCTCLGQPDPITQPCSASNSFSPGPYHSRHGAPSSRIRSTSSTTTLIHSHATAPRRTCS
jgi:hypothetical protein